MQPSMWMNNYRGEKNALLRFHIPHHFFCGVCAEAVESFHASSEVFYSACSKFVRFQVLTVLAR
jgi:hypothetical protein